MLVLFIVSYYIFEEYAHHMACSIFIKRQKEGRNSEI